MAVSTASAMKNLKALSDEDLCALHELILWEYARRWGVVTIGEEGDDVDPVPTHEAPRRSDH